MKVQTSADQADQIVMLERAALDRWRTFSEARVNQRDRKLNGEAT